MGVVEPPVFGYRAGMALARILVDGYSLLHHWRELAPGKARHSAAAREELIHILRLYRDAVGVPLTVVFDGDSERVPGQAESTREMEILYSRAGQTADQIIERVTYRMGPYGESLAVTDDQAERETVISLGGSACSCENFVRMIENDLGELERSVKHSNQRERERFRRPRL
jgi:predicted RNA-binding protein with PIN domain